MHTAKVLEIDLSHLPPAGEFQLLRIEYIQDYFLGRIAWTVYGREVSMGVRVDFGRMDKKGDFVFLDTVEDAAVQNKLDSSHHAISEAIYRHFAVSG